MFHKSSLAAAAVAASLAILVTGQPASALPVTFSLGSTDFTAQPTVAGPAGLPVIDPLTFALVAPGGAFPATPLPRPPSVAGVAGGLAPLAGGAGPGPAPFGAGAMWTTAIGSAAAPGFPGPAFVAFGPGFVVDFVAEGVASIVDASGTAVFGNPFGFGPVSAGAVLAIAGVVPPGFPSAYVAAALAGTITIGAGAPIAWDPIVIRSDGAGALLDGVFSASGAALTDAGYFPGPGGTFVAYGVSLIPGGIAAAAGDAITVSASLTLIADPPFGMDLIPLDDPRLPPIPMLPALGAAAAVPEPATLALFGLGLAGLGMLRRRRA